MRFGKESYSPAFADMRDVRSFDLFSTLAFEVALLTSVVIRFLCLIGSTARLLLTWQRSLCGFDLAGFLIQGAACCIHNDDDGIKDMDTKDDDKRVPTYDGKLDSYRDYRRRALLYFHGLEDNKQSLAAPRLIAALSGPAFECFRERDPGYFRNNEGVKAMLEILDARFQYTPEQELSEWMETLLYKLRRQQGEETTSFTTRFETTLAKTEELVTEEMRQERRRQQDQVRAEYRRQSLDYIVAQQQHQATVSALPEGVAPPPGPTPPTPPAELAAVVPFRMPEVLKGFLYLRHVGISLQTRASLLRSAGGSLRYDKVAELLRRTELDSLVASKGAKVGGHSYFADLENEDYGGEPDDDDFDDDSYYDDDDEYGGYAEDDEEDFGDDDEIEEDADDDYNTAMIGYLEARKKLMSLRKSRGFKDPPEATSGKGVTTKAGKGKDSRHKGQSYPGRVGRGDFQWRSGSALPSRSSSQSRSKGGQHRKSKGQGKRAKGQGRRSSGSTARRGDPNGSQYLGLATSAPSVPPASSTSSASRTLPDQALMANFAPEFSFMAVAESRPSGCISEAEIDRCLMWDKHLGFEAEQFESEHACLAVPPGHAIVDTGCTSTLVGADSEKKWNEELNRMTGGALQAEREPSDVKFEGINGEARASYQVKYPVRLGGRDGFVKASVIPGKAPFLLSIQALRQMRAKLDCGSDTLEIPGIGLLKLAVNSVGHYLLPLFDFHSQPGAPPGLEHGLSAAAEENLGGTEDEGTQGAATRQDRSKNKTPISHPPDPGDVFKYQPRMAEVSNRTERLGKSVLLRLAKDTKGPWVDLPKELPAIHLILGKHGFVRPDVPWQIRAAQIGYRSKVVRRPPPALLKDASVLVIALGDKSFRVLKDWTQCISCAGEQLESEDRSLRLFLFVFAVQPQEGHVCQVPSGPQGLPGQTALMVSHDDCQPCFESVAQPLSNCVVQDCSEFHSCDEGSDHEQLLSVLPDRECASSRVCTRRGSPGRVVLQRTWSNVALCHLQEQLQGVPGPNRQVGEDDRPTDLLPSARLRVHHGSKSHGFRQDDLACHRRSCSHGRRRHLASKVSDCSLSLRHPQDHNVSERLTSKGFANCEGGYAGAERFQLYGQCGDSEAEDQGDSDLRPVASNSERDWFGQDECTSGAGLAVNSSSHAGARHQDDHGLRSQDDQRGVWRTAECPSGCDHGKAFAGTGGRAGGTSCRVDCKGGMATQTSRATSKSSLDGNFDYANDLSHGTNNIGDYDNVSFARFDQQRERLPKGSRRSRLFGFLGAGVAALVASCSPETCVPPRPFIPDASEDPSVMVDDWPKLSPEVGVEVPVDPGLQLPSAWKAGGALNMSKRATRAQLKLWLGAQAYKIDRGSTVGLVELYSGRGHLSDAHELFCDGSEAIRLGHMCGQDLRTSEGQWFTMSLIELCKPRDVFVSFPCKGWCRWSSFNERKDPGTRVKILRERLDGRHDLDLLFKIIDVQAQGHRHCHAENPQGSLAWRDPRFRKLRVPHGYVTFDQCALGLKHPRNHKPLRKATTVFTTQRQLAEHMSQYKCNCTVTHGVAEGSFRGRSVTSWCEDYVQGLAEALIRGMRSDLVADFGVIEPPHYDEHIKSNPVERCFVGYDNVIHRVYAGDVQASSSEQPVGNPAPSQNPDGATTIFKVTDPDMSKQLTLLQFPGRYQKLDLPVPVQTQLQAWSGLEVNTVVTSQRLKCFVNPPTGVVASRRTTLARGGGEWYYVEFNKELVHSRRKVRLPLNTNFIVTFFGDVPAPPQPAVPVETQPRERPLPGAPPAFSDAKQVHDYLSRLHVGLGHPGQAEFVQHLRDAGAAPWLLQQAMRFSCAVCQAQKPPAPHSVVGGPKPRSFNSILSIDTLDLTLIRDGVQHRVFLLTAVDTATSYARVFHLPTGDALAASESLKRGWLEAYGAPEYLYCDPDTIFRSETFAMFLTRHSIIERLSAAQAPFQHGQVERLHRTLRQLSQKVFQEDPTCTAYEAAVEVVSARNELMRVEGVSPAVLVFGKLPRAPPSFAEGDTDYRLLAERLQNSDPLYEVMMLRRVAARTAWVQSEVRDRTSRVMSTRSRPYKGPYYPGQVVLVYRRKRGDAANPGRHGVWLGPGEVIAVESTNDRLVPRVVYVTVHGRLFLCSPEQLRPVSLKAEWVMQRLQEDGLAVQRSFRDMRKARGIDVRNERPSSAELEEEHEQPVSAINVEELRSEAEYDPYPQAPPTVPGTPAVPGTPLPGTPRAGPAQPPPSHTLSPTGQPPAPLVPEDVSTPPGGEVDSGAGPSQSSGGGVSEAGARGQKRQSDFHRPVEEMSRDRAVQGPVLQDVPPTSSQVPPTVRTGEGSNTRTRSRSPPPPREGSFLSFSDFEGSPSDHSQEAWFTESQEHDYVGMSVGLSFDVELDEIQDEMSICYLVREMVFNASMARKRAVEVSERRLTSEEKEMFRAAKSAEWSQWVSNDVVELISRYGVDPKRIIASRWVLTWKSVPGEVHAGPQGCKAKARLVIRGFRDPDLGQFSTASPTLSRQGRHAVFTVASHFQYRVFTLDAKTAFLAGDQTSRSKPIYTELPKDLVRDQGYGEDVIARIKKVPYGLSEAPLAWYRRLTTELEACGFEQVPSDRCVYVLRGGAGCVLGIIGVHVDDLLVAGCSRSVDSRFELAMAKLVARLPFGERKYADTSSVLYTGLNVKQHPQTRSISIDQSHYVAKLKEVPTRKIAEGPLDKDGQTTFWSQLGALLWVAVNSRPDVAYDVSHFASYGSRPEKQHLVSLNKIVRTLQSRDYSITFSKVAESWDDLTLVVFTDAGHTSRPSNHSQSGTITFWAPKEVLTGKEVRAVLADYSSCKIDRAVWSSYASELQAATISADASINLLLLYEQVFYGCKAKQVKEKLMSGQVTRALVTDNKGLYDSIQTEKPSTRQGVKMQSLVYQILYDLVVDYGFKTFWVNGSHMLADGLTKLSSSGAQVDAIRKVLEDSLIRITYCVVSGRKEQHELKELRPQKPANQDLASSIDV